MSARVKTPVCVKPPTDPDTLTLAACDWCAGCGWEPQEEAGPVPCLKCSGGGYAEVSFDLGSTRSSSKGRPASYNPGLRTLTATVGRKTTAYDVAEFQTGTDFPGRAFEVTKRETGEVRHVYLSARGPEYSSCDCEAASYESTARADRLAAERGEPTPYETRGCVHRDACQLLLHAGLLDLPWEPPPADQIEPNPFA